MALIQNEETLGNAVVNDEGEFILSSGDTVYHGNANSRCQTQRS